MTPITKYVLRNLARSPFITALVLTSMVVVGATVGGVIGILSGLRGAFSSSGHDNRLVVSQRDLNREADSELPPTALGPITVRPEVVRFSPEVVIDSLVLRATGGVDPITLRGLEPQGFEMHAIELVEGRMPSKGAFEVIIGENMSHHMPWLVVGSMLEVVNEKFICVGIFRSRGYFSGEAWTTRAAVMADSRRVALSVIYLDTATKADAVALAEKIRADRSTIPLGAASEAEYFSKAMGEHDHLINAMMVVFTLVVFGAILVASSLLSLLQRRRIGELFTLRAIGFRARAIAIILFWETELFALSGGAVGLLVAIVALRNYSVLSSSPTGAAVMFSPKLSWQLSCVSLGFMFLVGLIGAIAPIVRSQRIQIASGLREE